MAQIKLKNLSLDYFQYVKYKSLKKTLLQTLFSRFLPKEEPLRFHRALEGVDAVFNSGDRIALLGRNGSGKSTLLRVLSGIYQPTSGSLEVSGRISTILDVNVGLNGDATGYENIVQVGILYGRTRKEMKAKFQEIETFAELGDYLKIPVKTYSSGMRLRLAFAIATSLESDILLIDEAIGVGDSRFMEKAQERMKNLIHRCEILVLASHSTQILQKFCNKAMVLQRGRSVFFGPLEEGISTYEHLSRLNS